MHRIVFAVTVVTGLLPLGCKQADPVQQENARIHKALAFTYDSLAPTQFLPVQSSGVFHPEIRGTWQAPGYGFVIEIGEREYHWYSATSDHAWEHSPEGPIEILFGVDQESGRCYVKPSDTESAIILKPIEVLPERFREQPATGAVATLERIDQSMTEFYPFFEARNFDWQARMEKARAQVTADTEEIELFAIVEELFDGLGDGHTTVSAEINGESRETPGGMSSIRRALEADYASKQGAVERKEYFGDWAKRLFAGIHDDLLHGKSKTAFEENIIWGKITPKVGYLLVRDMASFGSEEDLVIGLIQLHRKLEEIFTSFADCEAVIVDVSFNMGGFHSFAMAFASHLADKERFALCKYPYRHRDLEQKFHVRPYCDKHGNIKTFTKPVYVVTTDATVSAGEEFVLAARVFPHVKIVGTPTQGMLSDILEKPLPNGWMLGMSNEIFLDHQGKCYEAVGVPVDIEKPIFNVDNISEVGHADSILELAAELSK